MSKSGKKSLGRFWTFTRKFWKFIVGSGLSLAIFTAVLTPRCTPKDDGKIAVYLTTPLASEEDGFIRQRIYIVVDSTAPVRKAMLAIHMPEIKNVDFSCKPNLNALSSDFSGMMGDEFYRMKFERLSKGKEYYLDLKWSQNGKGLERSDVSIEGDNLCSENEKISELKELIFK